MSAVAGKSCTRGSLEEYRRLLHRVRNQRLKVGNSILHRIDFRVHTSPALERRHPVCGGSRNPAFVDSG